MGIKMSGRNRKVVLIGTGLVGMSYAYAMLNQNSCDELVLIDIDKKRAEGEAMDLNHGLAFSGSHMKIYAGSYRDCKDCFRETPRCFSRSSNRSFHPVSAAYFL